MSPGSPLVAEPPEAQPSEVGLATIALRQIRVSRSEVQDKQSTIDANPMNRLVPYLDLYGRLADEELARLAGVAASVVANLRRQVVQVDRALTRFTDLLPRLSDAELVRLTGATPKTIRFWRLCQPRHPMAGTEAEDWSVAQAAEMLGRVQSSAELDRRTGGTGTQNVVEEPPLASGIPLDPARPGRHPSDESTRAGSSAYRMPTAEREAYRGPSTGSSAGRIPSQPPMPVDLSRPRPGRTEEVAAASRSPSEPTRPPEVVQKQQAVAQQMKFSGAPFPGYDSERAGTMGEEDGIFIGLELPHPRSLRHPGRQD